MARELGIKNVAAIANKITENTQPEMIQSLLKDVAFLGSIPYSRSVQEADLEFKPVFSACPELVEELRDAKNKLTELISEGPVS
jgi:CO dehydrogenase nickel-insertion accessory protein CooC1